MPYVAGSVGLRIKIKLLPWATILLEENKGDATGMLREYCKIDACNTLWRGPKRLRSACNVAFKLRALCLKIAQPSSKPARMEQQLPAAGELGCCLPASSFRLDASDGSGEMACRLGLSCSEALVACDSMVRLAAEAVILTVLALWLPFSPAVKPCRSAHLLDAQCIVPL